MKNDKARRCEGLLLRSSEPRLPESVVQFRHRPGRRSICRADSAGPVRIDHVRGEQGGARERIQGKRVRATARGLDQLPAQCARVRQLTLRESLRVSPISVIALALRMLGFHLPPRDNIKRVLDEIGEDMEMAFDDVLRKMGDERDQRSSAFRPFSTEISLVVWFPPYSESLVGKVLSRARRCWSCVSASFSTPYRELFASDDRAEPHRGGGYQLVSLHRSEGSAQSR